jgi:RNA recognition motif-containing protein
VINKEALKAQAQEEYEYVLPQPYYGAPNMVVNPYLNSIYQQPVVSAPMVQRRFDTDKPKVYYRKAAGQQWEDKTLAEWPENDFRIFCGDLGNEVNDDHLKNAFAKYPSFQRAKVIRDKVSGKTKGYGFVSFSDPRDYVKALREMNGKYIGNRPVKLRKGRWQDYNDVERMTASQKQGKKGQRGSKRAKTKKTKTATPAASTST